jgi:hypothetical protein
MAAYMVSVHQLSPSLRTFSKRVLFPSSGRENATAWCKAELPYTLSEQTAMNGIENMLKSLLQCPSVPESSQNTCR